MAHQMSSIARAPVTAATPLAAARDRCRRSVAACASPRDDAEPSSSSSCPPIELPRVKVDRRHALIAATVGVLTTASASRLPPANALPLAPLGAVKRVGGDKRTDLTAQKVRDQLERDLRDGQYFVTGNLTREIFQDDCRFTDPTNDVVGLSRYLTALGLLFDPATSSVDLYDIKVTSETTVEAEWQLQGYLRFPWKPRVEPYTGRTTYTLDPDTKLVKTQFQTWNISGAKAIAESFTPTAGPGE